MTRKSKREIERAVDELADEVTGEPIEIVITERVVATDHDSEYEEDSVEQTRVWRDETGEWHSERVDVTEEGDDGDE